MGDSMSTIINATTTNGVVIQPDNSGSLVLQTNSGTTALTIDTSQRAAFVAGTAAAPAITTTGDTNTGMFFPAADTIAFAEGGAEVMRLDSSGNVGIGTSSPSTYVGASGGLVVAQDVTLVNNTTQPANNYPRFFQLSGVGPSISGFQFTVNTGGNATTAPTERMRIDSSGNLLFNSGYGSVATAYGCRAWVNFNGTGTVAIRASGNVTSITDNGTGDYTVNFTTAISDANYSAVVTGISNTSSDVRRFATISGTALTGATTMTTTQLNVIQGNPSTGTLSDLALINVAIFR